MSYKQEDYPSSYGMEPRMKQVRYMLESAPPPVTGVTIPPEIQILSHDERPADYDRSRYLDHLAEQHAAGRVDEAEYNRRIAAVKDAVSMRLLRELIADLPPLPPTLEQKAEIDAADAAAAAKQKARDNLISRTGRWIRQDAAHRVLTVMATMVFAGSWVTLLAHFLVSAKKPSGGDVAAFCFSFILTILMVVAMVVYVLLEDTYVPEHEGLPASSDRSRNK